MNYTGIYIYPPRPSLKAEPGEISRYDTGEYLAQPKYNGDAVIVQWDGTSAKLYNRHKEAYTKAAKPINIAGILPDPSKQYVIAGEYLSKNKTGENGPLNHVFIIWDILVWQGHWLINTRFEDRAMLMASIPAHRAVVTANGDMERYNHLLITQEPGIYIAPCYEGNFCSLFADITKTDLYEGLVLKKREGRLAMGLVSDNNTGWQIKFRKPTNNYKF